MLREYKVQALEAIIRDGINRKYKISFAKGMQMLEECLVLFVLMTSVILKANIFSLLYLALIFKYIQSRSKQEMLGRVVSYMSIAFIAQYALYVLNLTAGSTPADFPPQYHLYPRNPRRPHDFDIRYAIPLFFHFDSFRDLNLAYMIGVGVDKEQVQNLIIDFFNLWIVSMYLFYFSNPILSKSMEKIFWVFPKPSDELDKWCRLNAEVKLQVKFLCDPQRLSSS